MIAVIEGIDGSGKATQAKLLAEHIEGAGVFDFPHYETPVGQMIERMLRGLLCVHQLHEDPKDVGVTTAGDAAYMLQALMTVNRHEHSTMLESWRTSSNLLVLDRYWMSGYAYGTADGLDSNWLVQIHASLPQPDVWILLDVSPADSMKRRPERRDAYEADLGRLERAGAAYLDYFRTRNTAGASWYIVDGTRPVEDVHKDILCIVKAETIRVARNAAYTAAVTAASMTPQRMEALLYELREAHAELDRWKAPPSNAGVHTRLRAMMRR